MHIGSSSIVASIYTSQHCSCEVRSLVFDVAHFGHRNHTKPKLMYGCKNLWKIWRYCWTFSHCTVSLLIVGSLIDCYWLLFEIVRNVIISTSFAISKEVDLLASELQVRLAVECCGAVILGMQTEGKSYFCARPPFCILRQIHFEI